MEDLTGMLANLSECSRGANNPAYDEPEPETVECAGGCGHRILADNMLGYCYECAAAMHACGHIDLDDDHPQMWEPRERETEPPYTIDDN